MRATRTEMPLERLVAHDTSAAFLKVHFYDGRVYLLARWRVDTTRATLSGDGTRFTARRQADSTGPFTIALDSIALVESNTVQSGASVSALSVMTVVTATGAVYCAANPKACFGSCPTFYTNEDGRDVLHAEGFSAAIAPSLEEHDIDALYRANPHGRTLTIEMRNEAYETHVVRAVDLLAVPRSSGHRAFADGAGGFWEGSAPLAAAACAAPEGDCSALLSTFDGRERTSAADSVDLASREFVELRFDTPVPAPALVIASRQSLLPTFLLYQSFAYLGRAYGRWLVDLAEPAGNARRGAQRLADALGGIDVLVANTNGGWDSVTTLREPGPLAADAHVVPLPASTWPMRVRLRSAKGAWRLDAVGLSSIARAAEPVRLPPALVRRLHSAHDNNAGVTLRDASRPLVTLPGDRYALEYQLPEHPERYEYFLDSSGYYLEWMRREWLAEEDPVKAAGLFLDPSGTLRRLAPVFKQREADMETTFWRSKYAPR